MPKGGNGKGRSKGNNNDIIIETDGGDILFEADGDDIIFGTDGNDTLDGGEGSDTYISTGFAGVDTIIDTGTGVDDWDVMLADKKGTVFYMSSFGSENGIEEISSGGFGGVDIRGTAGDNVLDFSGTMLTGIAFINGLEGDDTITGSWGDDKITGGPGNDTIDGGGGNDLIAGAPGADTFVFTDTNGGVATIIDFTVGEDVIDLSGVTGTITYEQHGSDVALLADGGDFAMFLNVEIGDLI